MARQQAVFLLAWALALGVMSSTASAAIVEHIFNVENVTVRRLCQKHVITVVNGALPGPTIRVTEGDTLVVHVLNKSQYNVTIHWHGVFQLLSSWADGPNYITQCPIRPGHSYIQKFTITKQEGTLWWHAHVSLLRTTVYGALIILPKSGEWWNGNVIDLQNQAQALGVPPSNSDAFTINGRPGDLYPCSKKHTYKVKAVHGKTYMLRIINAALNNQLFFKIANHRFTVVAVDASYTDPYVTNVAVLAPGQTVDVLLTTNQTPGAYYMAARPYDSAQNAPPPDNSTTTGILVYNKLPYTSPIMPFLPALNDTPTAHKFSSSLTSLRGSSNWMRVPTKVDEQMFITVGLSLSPCGPTATCKLIPNIPSLRLSANMNNASFQSPTSLSLLQAHFFNVKGIYTTDFPDQPPLNFDYTNPANSNNLTLAFAPRSTRVKQVKYNATVEIVFQDTTIIGAENHPMHLHGYNFHVVGQGFGNFNPVQDRKKFNLFNPVIRNTIGVPVGGWAAIRFQANNPGVWILHCHLDSHLAMGLATAFVVENGPTLSSTLPPPPPDLPQC
ncbi:laccase-7-like isoform X2 [Syzygium oleosum]|uniref:laccase-7-like isoform X2 n=1 Tax=Syzygium oleosum TaxID=219896 RepID=UPI0011D245D1|nr:laccase-7-like isoform X2 [Syzygium oleosum]